MGGVSSILLVSEKESRKFFSWSQVLKGFERIDEFEEILGGREKGLEVNVRDVVFWKLSFSVTFLLELITKLSNWNRGLDYFVKSLRD